MEAADDVDGLGRERGVPAVRTAAVGVEEAEAQLFLNLAELVPRGAIGDAEVSGAGGERACLMDSFEQGDAPGGEGDVAVALEPNLGMDVDWCGPWGHGVMRNLA